MSMSIIRLQWSNLTRSHRAIGWCNSLVLTLSEIIFNLCLLRLRHIIMVWWCRLMTLSAMHLMLGYFGTWRSRILLFLLQFLLMQWTQICAYMQSWLGSNLLLLMHGYLVVELFKEHIWFVCDALAFCLFDVTILWFSTVSLFFLHSCFLCMSQSSKLMIEVIPIEKCLHRWSSQISQILFEFWIIKIFPFFVNVFLIEIFFFRRYKWCYDILVCQIFPWKAS